MSANQFALYPRAWLPWLNETVPWLLLAATLALFATETLFNVPFFLMAALGLYQCCRMPRDLLRDPAQRFAGLLFLCIWLPQLLALPDAANPGRSFETVAAYPHFFFAGVYIVRALQDARIREKLGLAISVIFSVWILDALLQYLAGANLFGYPYQPGQLTGMFYPKISLGHLLAALAPVYFDTLRVRNPGRSWVWLLAALLLSAVVFLSGRRAAWLMAGISSAGYIIYLIRSGALTLRALALALLIGVMAGGAILATNTALARRTSSLLGLFSGNAQLIDEAISHRLPLWGTAVNIATSHWINGVGPRGFRFVYREFGGEDNFFLQQGRDGQTHPHQLVLEVAAETGLIGLSGLILFWWLLAAASGRLLRTVPASAPWLIAGLVAWLPVNAHMAFYGSYWSSVSWWVLLPLLALFGAAARESPCPKS